LCIPNGRWADTVPRSRIQDVAGRMLRERYRWLAEVSAVMAVFLRIVAFGLALVA
jgi:hypothetical protein